MQCLFTYFYFVIITDKAYCLQPAIPVQKLRPGDICTDISRMGSRGTSGPPTLPVGPLHSPVAAAATNWGQGLAQPHWGPVEHQVPQTCVQWRVTGPTALRSCRLPCPVLPPGVLSHACPMDPLNFTYETLIYFKIKIIKNFKMMTEQEH